MADHPKLAIRYSNLALVEQDLGHLEEARELLQRAIAIGEKAYEADHPTLATSYNNLARVEQDLGNLKESRSLLRKAIAIDVAAGAEVSSRLESAQKDPSPTGVDRIFDEQVVETVSVDLHSLDDRLMAALGTQNTSHAWCTVSNSSWLKCRPQASHDLATVQKASTGNSSSNLNRNSSSRKNSRVLSRST